MDSKLSFNGLGAQRRGIQVKYSVFCGVTNKLTVTSLSSSHGYEYAQHSIAYKLILEKISDFATEERFFLDTLNQLLHFATFTINVNIKNTNG